MISFSAITVALSVLTAMPGTYYDYHFVVPAGSDVANDATVTFPYVDGAWDDSFVARMSVYRPVQTNGQVVGGSTRTCNIVNTNVVCKFPYATGETAGDIAARTYYLRVKSSPSISRSTELTPVFTIAANNNAMSKDLTPDPHTCDPNADQETIEVKLPTFKQTREDGEGTSRFVDQFVSDLSAALEEPANRFFIYSVENLGNFVVDMTIHPPSKQATGKKDANGVALHEPDTISSLAVYRRLKEHMNFFSSKLRTIDDSYLTPYYLEDQVLRQCNGEGAFVVDCDVVVSDESDDNTVMWIAIVAGIIAVLVAITAIFKRIQSVKKNAAQKTESAV
jgi:hypothetical protein